MAARASGQNTAWLVEGAHLSANPVVPCPQTTVWFLLPVLGVRMRPVADVVVPLTAVVTYVMRLPLARGASSGGNVADVALRTVPGTEAATADPPEKTMPAMQRTAT
jgi:hypothetical protein